MATVSVQKTELWQIECRTRRRSKLPACQMYRQFDGQVRGWAWGWVFAAIQRSALLRVGWICRNVDQLKYDLPTHSTSFNSISRHSRPYLDQPIAAVDLTGSMWQYLTQRALTFRCRPHGDIQRYMNLCACGPAMCMLPKNLQVRTSDLIILITICLLEGDHIRSWDTFS